MEIKASHVSVDGLRVNEDISKLLDKYNIKNYEDLGRMIFVRNKEISNNYFLATAYFEFREKIIMTPQLSSSKVYEEHLEISSKKMQLNMSQTDIDSMVKVTDLPLFVSYPSLIALPLLGRGFKQAKVDIAKELDRYSVANLKEKMNEFIIREGRSINALIYFRTGIGEVKYNQIMATLQFYDKYIEVLMEKYAGYENPFYYRHDEKLSLVREKRECIFNYLSNFGYEFVFGNIDNILENANTSKVVNKRLDSIEEVIANYVTFDEAINIDSPKVLSKFIVPYGRK